MKKHSDEVPIRTAVLALIIALITIAVFFLPSPPAEAPEIELKPPLEFIHEAEASEVVLIATTTAEVPEAKPVLRSELVPICSCESAKGKYGTPTHYEADGVTVLTGRVNPRDVGMCQINLDYHEATAVSMELDLWKEEDNIEYANWLYDTQGSTPWRYSQSCWQ